MIAESSADNREREESTAVAASSWLNLALVAAAFALSTHAYRLQRSFTEEWWIWVAELVLASACLCVAWPDRSAVAESTLRRLLRRACGVLSIVSLAAAVYYGRRLGSELQAGVATGVALIAFLLARWVPISDADARCLNDTREWHAAERSSIAWLLAAAGLVAAGAAAAINMSNHAAGFALWLLGLALVAVAAHRFGRGAPPAAPCAWREQAGPQLAPSAEAMAVLLVFLLAVALRVPLLADFPAFINSDEGRLGRSALKLFEEGFPDMFALGWNAFPNISTVADVVPIRLLGMGIANLRLSAAIFGLASLLVTYFWVRRWWGNVVALLAVLVLTINHEHINWSRTGLNNIQQVLVGMLMLATLARALQTRRPLDWVWFGYATGLSFLTYHAAKLFPALLFGVALVWMIGIRGFLRRNLAGGCIALGAFVVILGPHLVTIYVDWFNFYHNNSNRMDVAVLFDAYKAGDIPSVRGYISSHVLATLQLFTVADLPFLDRFLCIVALPGFGWMLWRWRDPRHTAVLGWLGGILLIGGMITAFPPNVPRLIGVLPVACLIPALIAGRVRAMCRQLAPARADYVVVPALALWLSASAYSNWEKQFLVRPWMQSSDQMTNLCRVIENTPLPAIAYTIGGMNEIDAGIAPIDCMMPLDVDRKAVGLADDAALFPIRPAHRGTALFIFTPQQFELLPLLQHYYPRAKYEVILSRDNVPHLWTASLSPEEVERYRGLRVTSGRGASLKEQPRGSELIGCEECAAFPVETTAAGLVYIAAPGPYSFRADEAKVEIDGRRVAPEASITLPAGWHRIKATTTLVSPAERIPLEWKQPGATEWQSIAREYLNTHPAHHGLLGRYFAHQLPIDSPQPSTATPDYTQLVAALAFDANPERDETPPAGFASKGATMEWIGTIELPEGETQTLRLDTTSPARVFVNGVEVLASPGGVPVEVKDVTLTDLPPRSQILVRTVRELEPPVWFWWLRVLWRQPGGDWTAFADYHPPAE